MFITGTYNVVARPEWKNIQTENVYLECDTSLAPVVINLFPISDLKRFWNVKINIVDKSQNCSINNITINAGFTGTPPVQDIIDQSGNTQIVLSKDGESILITPVSENQWLANESITVPYAVQSVTGLNTDNTDPINPVVKISVDSATVSGLGTPLSPLESNLVVGTTQVLSGTSGAILFDNGTTVAESTNFVYDDGQIVLSLGGSTSSAKGMLNLRAKNALATSYSIAIRKDDDSGYLFQVQNDGKLRINDDYTLPNSDGTAGQVLVTDGSGAVTFQSKQDPITLTTTGNSGASTLIGATLNIPTYDLVGLGGVPLGRSININGTTQDLNANRTFTISDANLSMSDISTNNVSISQHGFAPKAPNDSTKFLDGTGNWQQVTLNSLGGVPSTRAITINGLSQDLSADRTWTISTGITVGTTPVTSGTDGRVFFQAGGVVQQDASFFWDNTNKRLGIGTTSPQARLDVKAQGGLSTDIAFRVRNSADTANIMTVLGTSDVYIGATITQAGQGHLFNIRNAGSTSIPFAYFDNNSYNFDVDRFCNIKLGFGLVASNSTQSLALGLGTIPSSRNFQQTVGFLTAISQGTNDSGFAMSGADTAGNNAIYTNYYGRNIVLGGTTQGTGTRKVVINNGTVPTTNLTDAFQLYSADVVAGNAVPHIRTEAGDIIKLYKQSSAGITTVADIVTVLTNLGLLG